MSIFRGEGSTREDEKYQIHLTLLVMEGSSFLLSQLGSLLQREHIPGMTGMARSLGFKCLQIVCVILDTGLCQYNAEIYKHQFPCQNIKK